MSNSRSHFWTREVFSYLWANGILALKMLWKWWTACNEIQTLPTFSILHPSICALVVKLRKHKIACLHLTLPIKSKLEISQKTKGEVELNCISELPLSSLFSGHRLPYIIYFSYNTRWNRQPKIKPFLLPCTCIHPPTPAHTHSHTHKGLVNGVTFTSLGENTLSNHISEFFQGNIGILGSILMVVDIDTVLWLGALRVWGRGNDNVRIQKPTLDRY